MPLKLRPTGPGSGIDNDRPNYSVYSAEWEVGRIYQTRGGPDNLGRSWSDCRIQRIVLNFVCLKSSLVPWAPLPRGALYFS
jgi:hypothetical protein